MTQRIPAILALLACATLSRAADIDAEPINYSKAPEDNVVSCLIQRLESGKATLKYEPKFGYLRGLLRELNVPESSQVLVFSRTSLQRSRISPRLPRAIYFNDDVYIGFCYNGDVLELSAVDPGLGTAFYTLDQREPERPVLSRRGDTCLICHASSQNQGIPGHVIRSVFADSSGEPILASGTFRIDQTSPLRQRWGGWYVSGTSGKQTHLGNTTFAERPRPEQIKNSEVNVTDLSRYFKTSNYLTPHSDIVALMVLEHQAQMHNLLAQASILTRQALHYEAELDKALGRNEPGLSDSTLSRIKSVGEPLVRYMLFCGEAELTDPIVGTSNFAAEFSKRGPFDSKGRSLRDLDLNSRLFKHQCSYLIYSESFRRLPEPLKEYVYRRLWEVLSGKDQSKEFAHLIGRYRRAIREILCDTVPDLPAYWREAP